MVELNKEILQQYIENEVSMISEIRGKGALALQEKRCISKLVYVKREKY